MFYNLIFQSFSTNKKGILVKLTSIVPIDRGRKFVLVMLMEMLVSFNLWFYEINRDSKFVLLTRFNITYRVEYYLY